MIDIDRPWICDTPSLNPRFPIYTRGNVGEVSGKMSLPLTWTALNEGVIEVEWRKALTQFGAFDETEFRPDVMDITALIHGFIYINLSISRVFGVRLPGASADLMDRVYLGGSGNVAPYVPHEGDDAPQYTERIMATIGRVLGTEERIDLAEDAARAAELRAARPNYADLSDQDLLDLFRRIQKDYYGDALCKHLLMVYESSIVTGMLQETLAEIGDPTLEVRLMGGWGEVASAAPTLGLWGLSRRVRESQPLTALFDAGMDRLETRIRSSAEPDATGFAQAFDDFLLEFGSRSTDEWEVLPHTWETHPHISLGMIDRMRLQPDDRSPELTGLRVQRDREELTEQLRMQLANRPELLGKLEMALKALSVWMPAREQSKTNCIRVLQELRLPFRELGRRFVDRGVLEAADDIGLLTIDEVQDVVKGAPAVAAVIPERREWMVALEELEPPFVVDGVVPPPSTWARRSAPTFTVAASGDVLTGLGACSGTATGVARVIHDPSEAPDLQPGEILVAPVTDPGWTPLFMGAEAVVVNVGSPLSHAAIVARELGIPAVLAVEEATRRIKDGALITVDGSAGTVTVH